MNATSLYFLRDRYLHTEDMISTLRDSPLQGAVQHPIHTTHEDASLDNLSLL